MSRLLEATHTQSVTHFIKGAVDQTGHCAWASQVLANVFLDAPSDGSVPTAEGTSPTGGAKLFFTQWYSRGNITAIRKDDIIVPGQTDAPEPPEDGDRWRVADVQVFRRYGQIHHVEVQLV